MKASTAKRNAAPLTVEILREMLDYNPETGEFRWRVDPTGRHPVGSLAGHRGSKGYWFVTIRGEGYAAHRLAWLYMTGAWPRDQLDHKTRRKDDNRWNSLREANNGQNMIARPRESFRTPGKPVKRPYRGVQYIERLNKYAAVVGPKHIGVYETAEEAREAYLREAKARYGDFAVHD